MKNVLICIVLGLFLTGCATTNKEIKKDDVQNTETNEEPIKNITPKTVNAEPIPVKQPDKIVRVLFFPWVSDKGILNTHSYKFIEVEQGEWSIGEYLDSEDLQKRVLTPLTKAEK